MSAFGYNSPEFFSEEIKEGELSKKEYLELVDKLRDDMFRDEKGPAFIETSLGKLGYMSIIYNMALIVANSSLNSLLSAINVVPWVNITNP